VTLYVPLLIVLVPFPRLTFSGIKMGMIMMAMGVKIFSNMLRNLRKEYASMLAFSRTTGSSLILKRVNSYLNRLLWGGLIRCLTGTKKDPG
jgi:hypothetical protein